MISFILKDGLSVALGTLYICDRQFIGKKQKIYTQLNMSVYIYCFYVYTGACTI